MPSEHRHLHPGSSTTTLNAATAHSKDGHQSAAYNQPDGRVHLGVPKSISNFPSGAVHHSRIDTYNTLTEIREHLWINSTARSLKKS